MFSAAKTLVLALFLCAAWGNAAGRNVPSSPELALPLWEVNLLNGFIRLPHYRGSDEYNIYAFPLPYLVYRGKILKADREGLKGVFRESEFFETGLSLDGSPPSYQKNQAREGMSDIGAIVEIGPMIRFFAAGRERLQPLHLITAIRMAISVDPADLSTNARGVRGEIKAVYRNRTLFENASFGMSAGMDFADRAYNGYFYDVAPDDVTASRPAYRSQGGYAGFSLSLNGQKEIGDRWSLGGYYRWDNLSGSIFRDSPLVKTENNHIFGCALILNLSRSERTVVRQFGYARNGGW